MKNTGSGGWAVVRLLIGLLLLVAGFYIGMSPLSPTGSQLSRMLQGAAAGADSQVKAVQSVMSDYFQRNIQDVEVDLELQGELLEQISQLKANCCCADEAVLRELGVAGYDRQSQLKSFFTELEALTHSITVFTRLGDAERREAGRETLLQVYRQVFEDIGPEEGVSALVENIDQWRSAGGSAELHCLFGPEDEE